MDLNAISTALLSNALIWTTTKLSISLKTVLNSNVVANGNSLVFLRKMSLKDTKNMRKLLTKLPKNMTKEPPNSSTEFALPSKNTLKKKLNSMMNSLLYSESTPSKVSDVTRLASMNALQMLKTTIMTSPSA